MSAEPSVATIDHVGLCVTDIEAATVFLRSAIGAEMVADILGPGDAQAGPDAEQRYGAAKGAVITAIRMLRLQRGPGIELFQVTAPDQRDPARASDLGWQHIAVRTDDLDGALERFAKAGGQVLPLPPSSGGARYCYTRAPFGVLIEFVSSVS